MATLILNENEFLETIVKHSEEHGGLIIKLDDIKVVKQKIGNEIKLIMSDD